MNLNFEFVIDFTDKKEQQEQVVVQKEKELTLENLLNINYDAEELTDTISIHDVCMSPMFYAGEKHEALSWLQPHSIDIAIHKLSSKFKKEFESLFKILGYRSVVYIFDDSKLFTSDVERVLNRNGFDFKRHVNFLSFDVYEFSKGYEESYIDYFNSKFTTDIFSILVVNKLEVYTVLYCDVEELIDILYYGSKNEKNIVMPIEISSMIYISEYLENKDSETTKIKDGTQFQLF